MKRSVNGAIRTVPILSVLTGVWCIWSESFSPLIILQGVLLAVAALLITNRVVLHHSYQLRYRIGIFILIRYIGVLVIAIFRSGWHAIRITLTDRLNVGVVDLPTQLNDPLLGVLTATAITLTPGTVAIDYSQNCYKVVWIDCSTKDPREAGDIIKGSFERVLLPVQEKQ